jgi:hypothetical protein
MAKLAFATYEQSADIAGDDQLVADELKSRGVTVEPAVWDSPEVDWSSFDGVIIRSTWDYHLRFKM